LFSLKGQENEQTTGLRFEFTNQFCGGNVELSGCERAWNKVRRTKGYKDESRRARNVLKPKEHPSENVCVYEMSTRDHGAFKLPVSIRLKS